MDLKKITIYFILISSIAAVLYQTPMIQAVGRGQHTFVSGRNVDCIACHSFDAYDDLIQSQAHVLDAHERAAANRNYTTYLEVGGISYDPAGIIDTSVDSDSSGGNDTWTWNGTMWLYNGTARLYDLDIDGNGTIDGSEICKLCHNIELMGASFLSTASHTVGTRYCDDDRCHGNRKYQFNSYLLFNNGKNTVTEAGLILSDNPIHGSFYNSTAEQDSNNSNFFHSYGQVPGNIAPGNDNNVSGSPFSCLGCHSFINVTGSILPVPVYNHSDTNAPKGRYT